MNSITTPTLLIDEEQCKKNIAAMMERANKNGATLRPHFKTHQSAQIGEWYREAGVKKITVSSVSMATYFAQHGWDDITIAFPVNIREIEAINALAQKITLNLMTDSYEALIAVESQLTAHAGCFIKIDTGYHRAGIPAGDFTTIEQLMDIISKCQHLTLKGFLTHAGHTYHASDKAEIAAISQSAVAEMMHLKSHFHAQYPHLIYSYGDTPSCSTVVSLPFDEWRPGNFIFYDLTQHLLGSCETKQIAAALICPVVACYPERNEVIIYGGGVHLSKEFLTEPNGSRNYGWVVPITNNRWGTPLAKTKLISLSQEHGIIQTTPENMACFTPGDLIAILPVHSCMTANLMRTFRTTTGQIITTLNSD